MAIRKLTLAEENLEDIREVFDVNHEMVFTYKDTEYYFTYCEDDKGELRRCFRIAPANDNEDALQSWDLIWLDDPTIDGVKIDGKTLPEIAGEIRITSIY